MQNLMQLTGVDLIVPTHGLEGAKSFAMGANCRIPLFDDSDDVFYIKSTDANGFPTVKKYRFNEELIIDPNNAGTGISLQDIRAMIREELGSVKEDLIHAQQSVPAANSTQYGDAASNAPVAKRGKSARSGTAKLSGQNSSVVAVGEEQQQPTAAVQSDS